MTLSQENRENVVSLVFNGREKPVLAVDHVDE